MPLARAQLSTVVGTVLLASSVAFVLRGRLMGRQQRPVHSQAEAEQLMSLWSGAHEVMVVRGDGNGRVIPVFLAPASAEGEAANMEVLPLPPHLKGRCIFALTAFDPPGISRSLEENAAQNALLGEHIRDSSTWARSGRRPSVVWPSYGFSLAEGWREDGFALVFDALDRVEEVDYGFEKKETLTEGENRQEVQNDVLRLAEEFGQGAIFGYREGSGPGSLLRTTIPCRRFDGGTGSKGADNDVDVAAEEVEVIHVKAPSTVDLSSAQKALLSRAWAGPADVFFPEQEGTSRSTLSKRERKAPGFPV